MRVLVAYATKYGMTGEYARAMAAHLGAAAEVLDLGSSRSIGLDLTPYDGVILGSSVYAGTPRHPLTRFLASNVDELAGKKLGLFLCGFAGGDEARTILASAFPEALRKVASETAYLPGWLNPAKANAFERFVIRMIGKAEAKKGKKPPEKPCIPTEAKAFLERCGFLEWVSMAGQAV